MSTWHTFQTVNLLHKICDFSFNTALFEPSLTSFERIVDLWKHWILINNTILFDLLLKCFTFLRARFFFLPHALYSIWQQVSIDKNKTISIDKWILRFFGISSWEKLFKLLPSSEKVIIFQQNKMKYFQLKLTELVDGETLMMNFIYSHKLKKEAKILTLNSLLYTFRRNNEFHYYCKSMIHHLLNLRIITFCGLNPIVNLINNLLSFHVLICEM